GGPRPCPGTRGPSVAARRPARPRAWRRRARGRPRPLRPRARGPWPRAALVWLPSAPNLESARLDGKGAMVDALAATIRWQQSSFEALGVPFYAALAHELLADLARDGPVAALLMPFADAPIEAAYLLRLLGGVHRMVLRGAAPELARHFPSVGGDGDAAAAMAALTDLVRDPPADVL